MYGVEFINELDEYFILCYKKRKLKKKIIEALKEGKSLFEVQNNFNFKINELNQQQNYNEDFIEEVLITIKKEVEKDKVKITNRKNETREVLLERTPEDLIPIIQRYEPTNSYTKTIQLLHSSILEEINKMPNPQPGCCNIL